MNNLAIKGKYTSQNKNKLLRRKSAYKSMWERRYIIYFDRSESILEWDSKSIHIPYISPKDDRWHKYYPDIYIKYRDKHDQINKALIEKKPHYQKKCDFFDKNCDKKKMEYKVLTERVLFK